MKRFEFVLVLALSILFPVSHSFAAELSVPSSQYGTIQAAITAAGIGDVVLVSADTYYENINFLGKAITVRSVNGAASTIIDGGGSGTLVTFSGGEGLDSVLDGFTVSNGRTGIYFSASSSATITDCIISNNSLSGVSINGSSPLITNSIISSNSANLGGGIYCRSSSVDYRSSPTITNSTISGNSAGTGGGIYGQYYCSITIQNSTISNNTATSGPGGGVYFMGESLEIIGSAITGNTAGKRYGGGIYAVSNSTYSTSASLTISKSDISGNSGGYGGGIFSDGTPTLTNTLVTKNTADYPDGSNNKGLGGGIYTNGCTIMNCTIADNTALSVFVSNPGGGIYASKSYPITITNSILYGNKKPYNGVSQIYPATINPDVFPEIQITYNNINQVVTGLGNINRNPWFVDSYNGDYHQRADGGYYGYNRSIDLGTSIGAPSDDLDGASRPARYGYDMGAYEVPPCLPDGDGDGYYPSPGCGTDVDCDDADPDRHPGRAEVCGDGIDNNCDEDIDTEDEDCVLGCETGTSGWCYAYKAGICGDGTRTCVGGFWGDCVQDTQPTIETCDGLDNDCNGLTDEFLATPVCDTGEPGVCAAGTEICQEGNTVCVFDTPSSTEICDNLDNDCDGSIDEEVVQSCEIGLLGVCALGTETCDQGNWGDCLQDTQASTEICDGLDNNCDDAVDEGFDADSDGTADCFDDCPDDPDKISVGTCGCGTPDIDTDGDGTLDCNEECPDDPDKIFAGPCGCGVPVCPQLPLIDPDTKQLFYYTPQFGSSVAISDDGTIAVIGAINAVSEPYTGNGYNNMEFASGRVFIFKLIGNTWVLQQKLDHPTPWTQYQFGMSVSLSGDGSTILVGSQGTSNPYANQFYLGMGAAYAYVLNGSTWELQQELTASDPAIKDYFGHSVTLSYDGNTAVVGAHMAEEAGDPTSKGAAYVFVRNAGVWTQQQRLKGSGGAPDMSEELGWSVSLSDNGNTLIAGAPKGKADAITDTYHGLAYVFTRNGTTWTQEQMLYASLLGYKKEFGVSVSLSRDGNTAIVGTKGLYNSGEAYVFTRSGTTWTEHQKIVPADNAYRDLFGVSVAISGDADRAIIGARYATIGGISQGAAYTYTLDGSTWVEQMKHFSEYGIESDYYGNSVAISDDGYTALAGAPLDDAGGHLNQGAVYVIPTVIEETNIAPGAVDVAVDTGITITFDQPMDGATINDTTFTLTTAEPAAGAAINSEPVRTASINEAAIALATSVPVAGTVSYDEASMTATFTPSSALAKGTKYTVALVSAEYANGTAMVPYIWSFTTLDTILSGDINNDGNVNLADAILTLKILSNVTMSAEALEVLAEVLIEVDVNNDGLIGLEEAVYALQVISERRP